MAKLSVPDAVAAPPSSDEAVAQATGRDWAEWCRLLDRAGARAMAHAEIARLLAERHKVEPWWSQQVAVGYGRIRGLRALHQGDDGFQVSVQRTLPMGPDEAWDAVLALASAWLQVPVQDIAEGTKATTGSGEGEVRAVRRGALLRVLWQEKGWTRRSRAEVTVTARQGRTTVRVQHAALPDADAAERHRAWWKERLARLG